MSLSTAGRHVLVIVACFAGVVGMGIVFSGAMHGSVAELSRGVPFLLIGIWWAGRDLARSMLAARNRRPPPPRPGRQGG